MPRKPQAAAATELSEPLQDFLEILEGQKDAPDRVAALDAVTAKHGVEIDLERELEENDLFAEGYARHEKRLTMRLQDKMHRSALTGGKSAAIPLRGRGGLGATGSTGRLQLDNRHAAAVEKRRSGW